MENVLDLLNEINNPKGTPLKYDEFIDYQVPSLRCRSMEI